ncbi:MAG: protein kinase [Actinomycetia bacterium]|nr:protein kinase [Actinomycetes bacterium]
MGQNKEIIISNRYRIEKKIASGGMADIYLGEDLKLDRKVAIKILSPNYAGDRNFVARFKREAQILTKLDHANIVDIYDWGKFDGSYYIVMEYVRGTSLKELIERKGSLDPNIAANYAIQISNALSIAHKNNLIHRDIKPQNILITPDGIIKVTDFGIAKSLNTDITRTLNIVGTAHYISPEQVGGDALDNRTDIYSLGVVIYEMLTGDLPFRGDTSIDISFKHVNEKPVKPSLLISNIPKKLEKIVMVCMEKKPSKRYFVIEDLKGDLVNFLEKKPLLLGSKKKDFSAVNAFSEKLRKSPGLIAASVLALIFVGLFIIYAILYYQKEPGAETDLRVPPIENISIEAAGEILSFFGLEIAVSGERSSDVIPKGHIIKQTPGAYSDITEDGLVEVIISSGSGISSIKVPNIIGLKTEWAREILEERELELGTISTEFSKAYDENIIISQDPSYGMEIEPGETIDIIVSKGPEIITVPNIIGSDLTYASKHLNSLGIHVIIGIAPVNEIVTRPGLVVSVEPWPGTPIDAGSVVEIRVSVSGPLNEIPDLVGLTAQEAMAVLSSLKIVYEVVDIVPDYSFQKDEVLGQWPENGSYLPPGLPMILYIGK